MDTRPLKTVFLDYDTVSNGDLDLTLLREASGELILYESSDAKIAERIHDADVALLNKLDLTRELLRGASRLKLVALAATGTNNVDLSAARELGIAVCNVWGLILSLTQHVYEFSRLSKDGSWARDEASAVLTYPIRELHGRIFGVVGWGELGRGAARIAEAFRMQVKIANRPRSAPQSGRVGGARSAAALPRRDGGEYPRFPQWRAARPRDLAARATRATRL